MGFAEARPIDVETSSLVINPRRKAYIGGGLLQSFGDFCLSVRRNPLLLNGKGRYRESTHS